MATILLVEPEASVRKVLKFILERTYGHTVLEATHAAEAFVLYKSHKVDLVLTAITLEGLSGTDLVRRVREDDPKAKVLMMALTDEKYAPEGVPVLFRPFQPETLEAAVQDALR